MVLGSEAFALEECWCGMVDGVVCGDELPVVIFCVVEVGDEV
jgi:hypothetical protein